jgi:trigger factor
VKTTVTELPESRVRVEAQVPPEEVERRVEATARTLGRDMRIPGFRKGKVPPPVVIKRIGRPAVVEEAVRSSLGRWYVEAIGEAQIAPVGDPQLDVGDLPGEGEPLTFSIEIGVRPTAKLGEYKGLEVPRREPDASDEAIDAEVEQLRERAARLETVEETAENGDFVVMDYEGFLGDEPFEGGAGRDQLLELGSGQLVPGFEEQLTGSKAGDHVVVNVTFPPDYRAEQLAGQDARFEVDVKEVKRKQLPELDDEFALEAGGADTLDELRDDIRKRLAETDEKAIENEFREAVLDAAVANAEVEVPEQLVEARARELFDRTMHSLQHRGIAKEMYLQIAGKTEEELLEEAKPDAEQALRRDAVMTAIVAAEGITASDDEVLQVLTENPPPNAPKPEKLLEQLRKDGRIDDIRDDLVVKKVLDFLVESAKPVAQAPQS